MSVLHCNGVMLFCDLGLELSYFQVDERVVAGDGFMLNLMSVMGLLSFKILLNKVRPLWMLFSVQFSSFQFSSRWYLCAQEAHMHSTPSLRSFPKVALETVPMLV